MFIDEVYTDTFEVNRFLKFNSKAEVADITSLPNIVDGELGGYGIIWD